MIGYEMSFSPDQGLCYGRDFSSMNDMAANMATLFVGGVIWRSSF
jgi:hypothetical protein